MNYVVSVPWSKVKLNEVILAWSMNGSPLPLIHGFPLRAVVMGYIGARSVKWLYRIKALPHPSRAPVQSREYLYFNSQVGKHNQLYTSGIQIQEMPVSSAIMEPMTKEVVVHEGRITVRGWAYSGGGRWPERVEVSPDGGFVWYEVPPQNLSKKHKFAWRTWHLDLPVDAEGWLELCCRTWDNALNTQPTYVRSAWNWGLHVTSSCHRVKIFSVNKAHELTRKRMEEFNERGVSFVPLTRPTEFRVQSEEEYDAFWERNDPRDVDE
jgi:sulfite oxidase